MEIDEKTLKALHKEGKVEDPTLRVMDRGMNVALVVGVGNDKGTLHTQRGGVRIMSPQAGLRFAQKVLGADEITVVIKNDRK